LAGRFESRILKSNMTDRSIKSELKDVHKKLEDIEKKQEMLHKIHQMDRDQQEKMAKRPISRKYEMM